METKIEIRTENKFKGIYQTNNEFKTSSTFIVLEKTKLVDAAKPVLKSI